jgi:hypothetical protein
MSSDPWGWHQSKEQFLMHGFWAMAEQLPNRIRMARVTNMSNQGGKEKAEVGGARSPSALFLCF